MACALCVGGSANLSLVAEANGLRVELAAARQESRELRAALEADPGVIFTDGRQLTTNERHLLNLLSWRVREAESLKAELRRTRGVCDSLAHRCSEQSDLITRRLANVVCQSTGGAE